MTTIRVLEFDAEPGGVKIFRVQAPVVGHGRYIRQTSEPGAFGDIRLTVTNRVDRPAFRVEWRVPDTEVPDLFADASLEGVRQALVQPLADGSRLAGALVTVDGGAFHEVDASPAAYRIAAALAVKDALTRAYSAG
jgi:elongation factor G